MSDLDDYTPARPGEEGYEEEREYRIRMSGTPWAYKLQELVMAAYSFAKGRKADQLYSLSEQLEGAMNKRQEVDRESVALVLEVVWSVAMEREAA